MSKRPPVPRFTVITLGVRDIRDSIAFYGALGFERKYRATGEAVAFFDTGATVIALFPREELARDTTLPENPRPAAFRGITLAWNCRSTRSAQQKSYSMASASCTRAAASSGAARRWFKARRST